MSKLNYIRTDVLYTNPEAHVTIYRGYLQPSNNPVAIKEEVFPNLKAANQGIQEGMNMTRLSHPSICKIYDCSLEEAGQGTFKSVIITELLGSDLFKQIGIRKQANQPWTDAELMGFFRDLVSALSYAQKMGVSHRDIKPQNIFTSADGTVLKIGDFGSAVNNADIRMTKTLQGSPFYLSPELKRIYAMSLTGAAQSQAYDPYKSDVYSLGVTFLYMATMESPNELMNVGHLATVTERLVSQMVRYPLLQKYVRLMLTIEASQRPSFVDLDGILQKDGIGNGASSQGGIQQPGAAVNFWNSGGHVGSPQVVSQEIGNHAMAVQEKPLQSGMTYQYQPGPNIQQPMYRIVSDAQQGPLISPPTYQQSVFQPPPEVAYNQPMQRGQFVSLPQNPAPQFSPGYAQRIPQQAWQPVQPNPPQMPASPGTSYVSRPQYNVPGSFNQAVPTVQGMKQESGQRGSLPVRALPALANQLPQSSVNYNALRYCQTCKKPFLIDPGKEGIYCSSTCNPQKMAESSRVMPNSCPQTTAPNKKCANCPSPILRPLQEREIPPELRPFSNFAPYCCSMACLAKYKAIACPESVEDYQSCVYCPWKAAPNIDASQIVVTQCKHCFHNKDCFFEYLRNASRNFSINWIDIICPRCQRKSDYHSMINNAFGQHYFDFLKENVRKASCCVCGSIDVRRKLECGHLLCGNHYYSPRCSYCNA